MPRRKVPQDVKRKWIDLYYEGRSFLDIANATGYQVGSVYYFLTKKLGLASDFKRGSSPTYSRDAVARAVFSGLSYKELEQQFDAHPGTIRRIVKELNLQDRVIANRRKKGKAPNKAV